VPPPCNSAELHSRIQYRVSEKWAYNTESLTQKPTSPNHRLPLTAFETHSGRSIFAARTAFPAPERPFAGVGHRPSVEERQTGCVAP
jgi:hypothetical protein